MIPASRVVPKSVSFHSVEKHYATNSIDKAFKSGTITERDIALMREFVVEKQSCYNITLGRANNRLEFEEQLVIRINPKAPIGPLQFITIIIKPPSGTSLTIRRVSPPTIQENNIFTFI